MSRSIVRKPYKAMLSKLLSWKCPLCTEDEPIVRGSSEHLEMAVASHIIGHEQRASLKAVDLARIGCRVAGCEIGRKNQLMLTAGTTALALSEFDKLLLAGMRIGID